MKSLTNFLESRKAEQNTKEETVFVVRDREEEILSVCDTKEAADEEVKKWNSESGANEATISEEPRKNYIKDNI